MSDRLDAELYDRAFSAAGWRRDPSGEVDRLRVLLRQAATVDPWRTEDDHTWCIFCDHDAIGDYHAPDCAWVALRAEASKENPRMTCTWRDPILGTCVLPTGHAGDHEPAAGRYLTGIEPDEPLTVEDIRRIHLHPGEVLVMTLPGPLSKSVASHATRYLEGVFPNNRVLVCEQGTDFAVIHPEETP